MRPRANAYWPGRKCIAKAFWLAHRIGSEFHLFSLPPHSHRGRVRACSMEAKLARNTCRPKAISSSARSYARTAEVGAFPLGVLMLAASIGTWAQTTPATGTLGTATVTGDAEVQDKEQLQTSKTNIGKSP